LGKGIAPRNFKKTTANSMENPPNFQNSAPRQNRPGNCCSPPTSSTNVCFFPQGGPKGVRLWVGFCRCFGSIWARKGPPPNPKMPPLKTNKSAPFFFPGRGPKKKKKIFFLGTCPKFWYKWIPNALLKKNPKKFGGNFGFRLERGKNVRRFISPPPFFFFFSLQPRPAHTGGGEAGPGSEWPQAIFEKTELKAFLVSGKYSFPPQCCFSV